MLLLEDRLLYIVHGRHIGEIQPNGDFEQNDVYSDFQGKCSTKISI